MFSLFFFFYIVCDHPYIHVLIHSILTWRYYGLVQPECRCVFVNATATTEIYTYWHTLSLHDALPISLAASTEKILDRASSPAVTKMRLPSRSEEHTSELQSLMRNWYAVFCLKKKTNA